MLKTRMLLALVLAVTLAGCGYMESRKNAVARAVAGSVICPIMLAQALSPLTQGSHGETDAVAPRAAGTPSRSPQASSASPEPQELAVIQRAIAPVALKPADVDPRPVVTLASLDMRELDMRELELPVVVNVSASDLAFPADARSLYTVIERERATHAMAAAQCAVQRLNAQLREKKRLLVITRTENRTVGS